MKKQLALFAALALACGTPVVYNGMTLGGFEAVAQTKATGVVLDETGEPLAGVSIIVKGKAGGVASDLDGKFAIAAEPGQVIQFSYVGYKAQEVKFAGGALNIQMQPSATNLDEVVVTALGIKKDKKSLGYAIDEIKSDELMLNKNTNAINSLSGKIAGVTITQSSGAAGAGSQIILRGGTSGSESRDNQPLFVVDGVIYDNSSSVGGNSAFDGSMASATTSSNRVMDINPEDIENMSVLKGPAAAALYGSRAANGVVLITTKKGKEGAVEVNLNAKYITSWAKSLPETQRQYVRGYYDDRVNDAGVFVHEYKDDSYNSWGRPYEAGEKSYDNIGEFFQNGGVWDTNLSVSGGNKDGNFFLSGSFYDQDGIVPTTGYTKSTFRFNGEQKWRMLTFGANVAYSEARTTKTLTGAALYGSSGTGALYAVYNWSPYDDMTHYLNEDGTRYRMFGNLLQPWEERDNPYWIVNKNKMTDKTKRFTGNFNVKADITDWWWIAYRMGIDTYRMTASNRIAPNGAIKKDWQNGFMSDNTSEYDYLSTNLMTNFNKQFGDFNVNLMLGTSTDKTSRKYDYLRAYNFSTPGFFSYENAPDEYKAFKHGSSEKRLVSVFGEVRADWKNTVFFTVTGRNDWTSTLPVENRSYFYPSYSGALVVSQFLQDKGIWDQDFPISFAKVRASWAKVGKDTGPYETNTYLWPVGTYLNGVVGLGNSWTRGNPALKPEMTKSTEIGLELRFFRNRLKFDYAYYTNDSYNQILSPRGPQSTGYIFCSFNAGNVYNKGMELSISGTPIETKDFSWETGINVYGNRGTMDGLLPGMDIMYVTDVQYSGAKAASYSGGDFMAIAGSEWQRVNIEPDEALKATDPDAYAKQVEKAAKYNGMLILDKDGMPQEGETAIQVGNREPKFQGGFNNTFRYKNWTFNMLWEFRVGGDVFNGTKYAMTMSGTSQFSADVRNRDLTISGVQVVDGEYVEKEFTFSPSGTYVMSGKEKSGYNVIRDYYQGAYNYESRNWITDVNSVRLRSISVSYELPKTLLEKTRCIKRASLSFSANNLLLFTNYDGDPEVAAAGAGAGGSSSVGFDYCGVPATASCAFGVNLTF